MSCADNACKRLRSKTMAGATVPKNGVAQKLDKGRFKHDFLAIGYELIPFFYIEDVSPLIFALPTAVHRGFNSPESEGGKKQIKVF